MAKSGGIKQLDFVAESVTQATGELVFGDVLKLGVQLAPLHVDGVSALRLVSTWVVVGNFYCPGWLRRCESGQRGNSAA